MEGGQDSGRSWICKNTSTAGSTCGCPASSPTSATRSKPNARPTARAAGNIDTWDIKGIPEPVLRPILPADAGGRGAPSRKIVREMKEADPTPRTGCRRSRATSWGHLAAIQAQRPDAGRLPRAIGIPASRLRKAAQIARDDQAGDAGPEPEAGIQAAAGDGLCHPPPFRAQQRRRVTRSGDHRDGAHAWAGLPEDIDRKRRRQGRAGQRR